MSDIYSMRRPDVKSGISTYIIDDIGGNNIDLACKLLAGIPHAADMAIGSAIKRAGMTGETYAGRAVRKYYTISHSTFLTYTKRKRHIVTNSSGTSVEITFWGIHVPLLHFDTKVDSSGRVITRVKKSSSRTVLEHVFDQKVGTHGHYGVFERITSKRLPIEEKLGPSTPQMMDNEEVELDIGEKIKETFDQRLEHEVDVILSGLRQKRGGGGVEPALYNR